MVRDEAKRDYIKGQQQWIKKNNIEKGTKLFMARRRPAEFGWDNSWESEMDENHRKVVHFVDSRDAYGVDIAESIFRYPYTCFDVYKRHHSKSSDILSDHLKVIVDIYRDLFCGNIEYVTFVNNENHTVCVVYTSNDDVLIGASKCNPSDTYDEKYGEMLAFGRALRSLE